MKLMGKCQRCDRDLLLEQLLVPGGATRCPWCGAGFARHYSMLLHRLIPEIERAGRELTRNLNVLAGDWTGFELNERSVLGPIERALDIGANAEVPAKRGRRRRQLVADPEAA